MLKRLALLCTLLAAASAQAMWVTVTRNETATVYVDSSAILKMGNIKRIWVVYDLAAPDNTGQMSVKSYMEYDCSEGIYKTLSATSHPQRMGNGPALKTLPINTSPKPVSQDAMSRQLYAFACAW
jgi:hypothetical protein